MWREVLEHHLGLAGFAAPYVAGVLRHAHRRPVGWQTLTVFEHPLVIHVELLATCERAPGNGAVHVDGERRVAARAALGARPLGGGDHLARLGRDVREGDELLPPILGEVGEPHAGALLHLLEALDREPAVGRPRERQDRLANLIRPLELRSPRAYPPAHRAVAPFEVLDLLVGLPEV